MKVIIGSKEIKVEGEFGREEKVSFNEKMTLSLSGKITYRSYEADGKEYYRAFVAFDHKRIKDALDKEIEDFVNRNRPKDYPKSVLKKSNTKMSLANVVYVFGN